MPPAACCRGQALTEFLVLSLVLIPLFLLLPMIGKYQDIAHATQMASRYAAFDAILRNDSHNRWKPPQQLEQEIRQRFFGPAGAAIDSESAAMDSESAAMDSESAAQPAALREGWTDPWSHPLLAAPADVRLSFGASHGADHADAYADAYAGDMSLFPLAGQAGLASRGIYRANVTVALANLPAGLRYAEPFDRIDLRIERHASVLPDPWMANSPAQAEARFGRLAPVNQAMPVDLVNKALLLVDLGSVKAPNFGKLEAWRDVVPADRLRRRE
jgi:hypothetical protein